MNQQLRKAEAEDVTKMYQFLGQAGLHTEGIEDLVDNFLLMTDENDELTAMVGIEEIHSDGFIRSLVFKKDVSKEQVVVFFQGIIEKAKNTALDKLFLLTPTESTGKFFEMFGFEPIEEVPAHIQSSAHYEATLKKFNPLTMVYSTR